MGFERSFLKASQIDLFFCLPILHKQQQQQQHGKDLNCILYSLFKISAKKHIERKFHIFFWREISNHHLVTAMADREEAKPIAVVFPL